MKCLRSKKRLNAADYTNKGLASSREAEEQDFFEVVLQKHEARVCEKV